VKDRLGIRGARLRPERAEAVLRLWAIRASEDREEDISLDVLKEFAHHHAWYAADASREVA
jgi:hypothetical protein